MRRAVCGDGKAHGVGEAEDGGGGGKWGRCDGHSRARPAWDRRGRHACRRGEQTPAQHSDERGGDFSEVACMLVCPFNLTLEYIA